MSEANAQTVRRVLKAFSLGDLDLVLASWSEDAVWRPAILGGGVLEGAVYGGHAGAREFLEVQREAWASVTAEPVETRVSGDLVLVEVRLDAVGRTSGASVQRTTWNVFEVRDGLIEVGQVFLTEDEALNAFGVT